MIDLNRIEKALLRENYLTLLGFPTPEGRGYIPLRVVGREFFYFMYDPVEEGQIPLPIPPGAGLNGISDLGWVNPTRLSSTYLTGKPFNVFEVKDHDIIFQLFYGISPSALRIYLEMPANTGQRNLDVDRWGQNKAQFGYIDGFDSPLLKPSPNAEIVIPPEIDFALGYANPLPVMLNPLFLWVVNRLQVETVKDPNLIYAMLTGKVPVSIKSIGGLSTFNYSASTYYGVNPIPLGATLQDINTALGLARGQTTTTGTGATPPPINANVLYPRGWQP